MLRHRVACRISRTMQDLLKTIEGFGSPRIAMLGDFILDRYVYGDVERINPEAPVPVLRAVRCETRAGGTGNVAAAAAALGGQPCCIGVIGKDAEGDELLSLLGDAGADTSGLIRTSDRPTPVKTRYVGLAQHRSAQQMLRVDEESVEPLGGEVQELLRAALRKQLPAAQIVTLEDYNKGTFTDELTPQIIAEATEAGKSVIVDPAVISDYRRYRGATVIKPNRYEASLVTEVEIIDDVTLDQAARRLVEITEAQVAVITLDCEGAYLYVRGEGGKRIPHHRPLSVYEVSGAGDETLGLLSVALAAGCDYTQAVQLANVAGGLEVERFGFIPIRRDEIADEIRRMTGLRGWKVMDRARLAEELKRRRQCGETIVFTNGCFDLLHMGHIRYLQQARELGGALVVAINSDPSARRLKGPDRPVIGQDERAAMLAALECVDYVTIFEEDTAGELIELLKPDLQVKGGTTPVVVEREIVEAYGGKVVTLEEIEGPSTTAIINRILEANQEQQSCQ